MVEIDAASLIVVPPLGLPPGLEPPHALDPASAPKIVLRARKK
jgi:hypothetical protein